MIVSTSSVGVEVIVGVAVGVGVSVVVGVGVAVGAGDGVLVTVSTIVGEAVICIGEVLDAQPDKSNKMRQIKRGEDFMSLTF
jgi:hypothetical protein